MIDKLFLSPLLNNSRVSWKNKKSGFFPSLRSNAAIKINFQFSESHGNVSAIKNCKDTRFLSQKGKRRNARRGGPAFERKFRRFSYRKISRRQKQMQM